MRTRIRAGELRTPLMLAAPVVVQDPAGGQGPTTYPDEKLVYAKIEPSGGREWMNAVMLRDQIDTAVIIRYIPGMVPNATWRLRDPHAGTIYMVVAVLVDPKHSVIEMACRTTMAVV